MTKTRLTALAALAVGALSASCATVPEGPSVMALPGAGKSFDQFRLDDSDCRQYAKVQVGNTSVNDSAVKSGVTTAVIGTAIGAAAGALIGNSEGAGIGAGVGLLGGSLLGASTAEGSGLTTQQRYDNAYTQCMYAKGESVPVSGHMQSRPAEEHPYAPPPPPPPDQMPPR